MQDVSIYINLHETVLDYKHGNKEAGKKIAESYRGFIWKYVNLICHGVFDINDSRLRRFVSLYSSNVKDFNQYRHKKSVKENLTETSIRLTKLFSQYTEDEIRNELICSLLTMAKKYSDYERPSFHTYVERCFHFEIYRTLSKLIKDPITRQDYEEFIDEGYLEENCSDEINSVLQEVDKELSIKYSSSAVIFDNYSVYDDETLNDNWFNGITCSEVFNCITPFERKILVEHSVNKKTDSEIGDKYGLCRATINRRRLKAINKLKTALKIE